ncbi:hypothetical protein Tco_0113110, partial [Tanacetum coccineum]
EEQYFSYTTDTTWEYYYNDTYQIALSMWILTPDGKITITNVMNSSRTSEFCYGYDSGDGCVKESSLPQCRTNCVGFESNTSYGTGCVLWTGNLSFKVSPYQSSTWKYVISSQHLPSPSTAGKNFDQQGIK